MIRATIVAGAILVSCAPAGPVAYGPPVNVQSCAINEAQIRHTIVITYSGMYRVHWYDPPAVTEWQHADGGTALIAVGFGRGQVEQTDEIDGNETIAVPAYGGYWNYGPWPSCSVPV